MDLSQLNGATIRVPSITTRITPEGLNICSVQGSTPPPTDIVYIVDQTGSMKPNAIYVKGTDTSAWYGCNEKTTGPTVKMGSGTVMFHGFAVKVIDRAERIENVKLSCAVAGDPYSMRAKVVQSAIRTQASQSPQSYAGTINFGPDLLSTQEAMTAMSNAAGVSKLLASMPLDSVAGTNYEPALGWARILLYGGHSGASWVPASPNWKKAIVMISDGQPTIGLWSNALKASVKVEENGKTWTSDSPTIPPVYAIFLGTGEQDISALDSLSRQTNGKYYQIPPNRPDSLEKVLQQILGEIIHPGYPQSLTITNRTNGQTSHSVSVETNGTSSQMSLDSLVALEPGTNALDVTVQHTTGTQYANLTVVVSDAAASAAKTLLDSVWSPRCGDVSRLLVKPDNSGLAWADAPDRNLQLSLFTSPINYKAVPLGIVTRISKDTEQVAAPLLDRVVGDTLRAFGGSIPWQNLAAGRALAGDKVVRSASGWDSARILFRMPRDRRDTAVAYIALHRPSSVVLTMTESVNGSSGRVEVAVVDSESTAASVTVLVKSRKGDSVAVKALRGVDGVYRGAFSFQQGVAVDARDTVLQSGLEALRLDTFTGTYRTVQATTLVQLPAPRLRFLGADDSPRDTLSVALPVGGVARVAVQAYLGDLPCLVCSGWVELAASDPGIGLYSIEGTAIDSLRLSKGRLEIEVRGRSVVDLGSISWRADSIGSQVVAKPVRISPMVPDSVAYLDENGDGAFDRAVLYAKSAQKPGLDLRLPWPDSLSRVGAALDQPVFSSDSTAAKFVVRTVVPLTTGAKAPLVAKWRAGTDGVWSDVKVVDRMAPVPLRATLRRGTVFDTLRVSSSEPLLLALDSLDRLVSRWVSGNIFQAVSPRSASLDPSSGDLLLLFPVDSTDQQVKAADSIRFAAEGFVRDASGNAPGLVARKVEVEGTDPVPLSALLFDTDADGRADRVVLRVRQPLAVTDTVGFRWPDSSGNFQTRVLPIQVAHRDSGDRILVFDIEPFAFGSTACPSAGCQDLAWLTTAHFPHPQTQAFPLQDRVDPILLEARFAYAATSRTSDTLRLRFSEPLNADGIRPWIAWGRPGRDSLGQAVKAVGLPLLMGGNRGMILVDSTFPAQEGDSARIFAFPRGALSDALGNAPDTLAYWTPILFGLPSVRVVVEIPTPILVDRGQSIPAGEPSVTILVRKNEEVQAWSPLPGGPGLARPVEDYSSVLVTLNRIPDEGGLYIYDNAGVAVTSIELDALKSAAEAGLVARTRSGDFQILLAWNGCDDQGRKVATGIYLARVLGWFRENGHTKVVNVVRRIGVRRTLEANF